MDNKTTVSFSAVTSTAVSQIVNTNRVYANGKFAGATNCDKMQISLEMGDNLLIFALADRMDYSLENEAPDISVMEEIKRFHNRGKSNSKDIQTRLDEMSNCVEQTNNLIFSMSIGENAINAGKTSFAGIIICNGSIAAVNMGNCRVYKLEEDSLRLMVNDNKRAERLLKVGIINNEQAEMMSNQLKAAGEDVKKQFKKSEIQPVREGTIYLICSSGLAESINEDLMYEILSSTNETDVAANLLVGEAEKNNSRENITAVVLKIEKTCRAASLQTPPQVNTVKRPVKKNKIDIAKLVSTLVVIAIIAAVVLSAYTIWLNMKNKKANETSLSQNTTITTTADAPVSTDSVNASSTTGVVNEPDTTNAANAPDTTNTVSVPETTNENAAVQQNTKYTVKPGDNLMKISQKLYGVQSKYKQIMEANNITNPDMIQIGQVLIIP